MQHRIEAPRGGIDTRKSASHSAEIRTIEPHGVVTIDRTDEIEAGDAVASAAQRLHGHPAQLAVAACHRDAHCAPTAPWWR